MLKLSSLQWTALWCALESTYGGDSIGFDVDDRFVVDLCGTEFVFAPRVTIDESWVELRRKDNNTAYFMGPVPLSANGLLIKDIVTAVARR